MDSWPKDATIQGEAQISHITRARPSVWGEARRSVAFCEALSGFVHTTVFPELDIAKVDVESTNERTRRERRGHAWMWARVYRVQLI